MSHEIFSSNIYTIAIYFLLVCVYTLDITTLFHEVTTGCAQSWTYLHLYFIFLYNL